jgi:hypothetical protein
VKSSPIKRDPEKVREWQDRSRKPLARKSELGREGQRSTEARRASAPAAKPKMKPAGEQRKRSRGMGRPPTPAFWKGEVFGTICVVCLERPATEGHHIISVQRLRQEAKRRGFELLDVLWDRRNRLPVCSTCHARHTNRSRPIQRRVLLLFARWVFDFAREIDLEHVLDREYPDEGVRTDPYTANTASSALHNGAVRT